MLRPVLGEGSAKQVAPPQETALVTRQSLAAVVVPPERSLSPPSVALAVVVFLAVPQPPPLDRVAAVALALAATALLCRARGYWDKPSCSAPRD